MQARFCSKNEQVAVHFEVLISGSKMYRKSTRYTMAVHFVYRLQAALYKAFRLRYIFRYTSPGRKVATVHAVHTLYRSVYQVFLAYAASFISVGFAPKKYC